MDLSKMIRAAEERGFVQAVLPTEELIFEPGIRAMCEANVCQSYGSCWACPPAVGTLEECRDRAMRYRWLLLFSKKYPLEDSFDWEGMVAAMKDFKREVDLFGRAVKSLLSDFLLLSNEGCSRCKSCTWPSAPCRFPDRLWHSIEGYGLNIGELAKKGGIPYNNGPETVTWFGGLLFGR